MPNAVCEHNKNGKHGNDVYYYDVQRYAWLDQGNKT